MNVESRWETAHRIGLERQLDQLRCRWPQAHYERPTVGKQSDHRDWLIVVPGVKLPEGWNATICTVLMPLILYGNTAGPLNGFFVDLHLRLADGSLPKYSRDDRPTAAEIRSHPEFRGWDDYDSVEQKVMATRKWHYIAGHPQWRGLTRFWWRVQMHDPNRDTLYTAAMVCRERLQRAV